MAQDKNTIKGGRITPTKDGVKCTFKTAAKERIIVFAKTIKSAFKTAEEITKVIVLAFAAAGLIGCAAPKNLATVCRFSDGLITDTIKYSKKTTLQMGDTLREFTKDAEFVTWRLN